MNQSKEFAEGVVFALQHIHDFEAKHGHLHLDATAALSLCASLPAYGIIYCRGQFEVVKRTAPYSADYTIIAK